MIFHPLPISGAFRIELEKREDPRGFFARAFCVTEFAAVGIDVAWRQVNFSFTRTAGTLRGMHYQRAPMTDAKLVRCLRGAIHDVVVDIRSDSATFGQFATVELTEDNRDMLYVPRGLAHGFQTLRPDTELMYFHSQDFSPAHDAGLAYDDPELGLDWPLPVAEVSARDQAQPKLAEIKPWTP